MSTYEDLNLTQRADDAFFEMETNPRFQNSSETGKFIWEETKKRIPEFNLYLKRYINRREGLSWDNEQSLDYYLDLIVYEFHRRGVPVSFDSESSTTVKSAVKNWLTRRTVSRKAVLLLGFGLQMKPEDVNTLLKKGICEQGINPKDPFEVICWYCYQFEKDFTFFEVLMQKYLQLPAVATYGDIPSMDATTNIRNSMYEINGPQDLLNHLATLKTSTNIPRISRTATKHFTDLYDEVAQIIAKEEQIPREKVTDEKIQDLLYYYGIGKKENDLKPEKKETNLKPEKESDLSEVFNAKRLNRQRIGKLRSGKEQVTRFDLITMNFVLYANKDFERNIHRYMEFSEKTNKMLINCALEEITIQNPYEFFILACLRTSDPIGTFWDVWEQSVYPDEA